MQTLRGTKDILPDESIIWQYIYDQAIKTLTLSNYHEIRTPILEPTSLFIRSIGNGTDIVNKEMYSFLDQGKREITLRPEGTASIARAFINNRMYLKKSVHRLWYLGPMFRYERPQSGRQRQFHQLGIECIGSTNPAADVEVIRLANNLLTKLQCVNCNLEINSIGNIIERNIYIVELVKYLSKYIEELDKDIQNKLITNPLRILDSKNTKLQDILKDAPRLDVYLGKESKLHFDNVCEYMERNNIQYSINHRLVRGLDYYNNTAFEIKTDSLGNQDTICGGGRYDGLIEQLGGPSTPSVGWAIGIERLIIMIRKQLNLKNKSPSVYLAVKGKEAHNNIWQIIKILEKEELNFEMELSDTSFQKQLKRASKSGAHLCLILGEEETINKSITVKWLNQGRQKTIPISKLISELKNIKLEIKNLDKVII